MLILPRTSPLGRPRQIGGAKRAVHLYHLRPGMGTKPWPNFYSTPATISWRKSSRETSLGGHHFLGQPAMATEGQFGGLFKAVSMYQTILLLICPISAAKHPCFTLSRMVMRRPWRLYWPRLLGNAST